MFAALDAALERLYPTRVWGQLDDSVRYRAGVDSNEGQELADDLAASLKASTFFRPGDDDEYCDYIYILCLGREPCLVQLREAEVPLPAELKSGLVSELYLRVCLSSLARFAGVQQVAISGEIRGDELFVVESPRAGVYDAPLLPRFQELVAALVARGLEHIDFGEISNPPPGFDPADYSQRYGVAAPAVANYLFYPQPPTTEVSELVRLTRAAL